MKVLVTGGAGFVGSHVAERCLEKGDDVVVFDDLSRSGVLGKGRRSTDAYNLEFLKGKKGKLSFVNGDVRSPEAVGRAARGAKTIYHIAGQVAVTASLADPRRDFEVNALGTFNVMEAARENDAAVLFTSTNKVYGENVNGVKLKESSGRYAFDDPRYAEGIPEAFPVDLAGHSPYGASKLAGDLYVQEYAHSYGLSASVFRMSCIYGERQFGVEDQGWVAWFVIASLTGRPITVYGDGKQVRDVLYVGDLVDAMELALSKKRTGEVFNVGGGAENTLSLLELLDIIRKLPGCEVQTKWSDWREADQKVYVSDIRKAQSALGWKPKTVPAEGVTRLHRWAYDNRGIFATGP
ncbi:MAG: GDP-mannose 4,6-dehydratase [Nitrososphaerota archaeon]|nr:GDP-mannose 4,6-dehydratase [Nitrososphaerota archaeon]